MQCVHINIRKVAYIFISMLINHVNQINMANNEMDRNPKEVEKNNQDTINHKTNDSVWHCPSKIKCSDLPKQCLDCDITNKCRYGTTYTNATCKPKPQVVCEGNEILENQEWICRYCYQTEPFEHDCVLKADCKSVNSPRLNYTTNCTVKDHVICLGQRTFPKNVKCNWTGGYRWTTALALSITLGGFGADRFYLGHWQEGIGKLFSFGGLGVWTIIDVILISLHYLGPADGSLYI